MSTTKTSTPKISASKITTPKISTPKKIAVFFGIILVGLAPAAPAMAHDAPEGSEWVMADWMFQSFLAFAGVAVLALVVARRRGLLSGVEDAKYAILDIDEPDYYTPAWGRELDR